MFDDRVSCHNCGAKILSSDSFCSNCGSRVDPKQEESKQSKVYISKNMMWVIIAFLAVGAIFSYATAIAVNSSPDTGHHKPSNDNIRFEDLLSKEIKETQDGLYIDPEKINYDESTKSITIELHAETDFGYEKYKNGLIYQTFSIMSVLVKHPDKINSIAFVSKLPTIDTKGKKMDTVVYSAITNMDDAKNVNWENLKEYPDRQVALQKNFAYEFNSAILNN